jgi:DNA gyrase subunit A
MLMSTGGTVIKVPVEDVKRLGRATQGVIVMRTRDGEEVSTLAPVVEQADVAASVDGDEPELADEGPAEDTVEEPATEDE